MATETQIQEYIQAVLYLLNQQINLTPPTSFALQVKNCRDIVNNDITGIISTIIEFIEDSLAEIKFSIETDNPKLTEIFNRWLSSINKNHSSYVPSGFTALIRQYTKEKFISGFPIVKYNFDSFNTLRLPMEIKLLDPTNIESKGKNENFKFDYRIGDVKLNKNVFLRKDGLWYEDYPTPFLIRKGVWANYQLKKKIKEETATVLKEIIWYLFLFKRGDPNNPRYKTPDFSKIGKDLKTVLQDAKNSTKYQKVPAYVGDLNTQAEHILPDLTKLLTTAIYEQIDKDLLAGMGMIDIIQGLSSTRKESILNPKPLMQTAINIILDIENLLYDLLREIIIQNTPIHKKYFAKLTKVRIVRTPIKAFWSLEFKQMVRSFYDRGLISRISALDSVGFDLETELKRKERELKEGLDEIFYPPVIQNVEGKGIDINDLEDIEDLSPDKKSIEKQNYNQSAKTLEKAPYKKISDLPDNMTTQLQHIFMIVVNNALQEGDSDAVAFKKAWGVIRKIAKKNKNGKWIKKSKKQLAKASVGNDLGKIFEEVAKIKQLEIAEKKSKLIDLFLKENKE